MNQWQKLPSKGGVIGIVFTAISAAIFVAVAAWGILNVFAPDNAGANPGTFFILLLAVALLLLTAFFAFKTRRFFRLRYYFDRNALTVDLGDTKQIIPLDKIQQIATAENLLTLLKEQPATTDLAPETSIISVSKGASETSPISNDDFFSDDFFSKTAQQKTENFTKTAKANEPSTVVTSAADSSTDNLNDMEKSYPDVEGVADAGGSVKDVEEIKAELLEDQKESEGEEVKVGEDGVIEGEVVSLESEPVEVVASVKSSEPAASQNKAYQVRLKGLRWPGYYFTKGNFAPLGTVQFYSTADFARTVVVRTDTATYALSPRDLQLFVSELKLRRKLGATEQVAEGLKPGAFLAHPLWHDWVGRGLLAFGILCNLALFLYLLWRFPDLPQNIEIHFNKFGDPDRIGVASDLMWLPAAGLVAVVVNSVLGAWLQVRDKVPAYLLYAASIVVQITVAVALAAILAGTASPS